MQVHPVKDPYARFSRIIEDTTQQGDPFFLPVVQCYRDTQPACGQRADTAAVGDVPTFDDVKSFFDQIINPRLEFIPGPPAHAAIGVLHVGEIDPPGKTRHTDVFHIGYGKGIFLWNLLPFFEETTAHVPFQKMIHRIQR